MGLGEDIGFEVIKFCQRSENKCTCCGTCDSKDFMLYSMPVAKYTKDVQQTVDGKIDNLMKSGFSREDAVSVFLLEDEGGEIEMQEKIEFDSNWITEETEKAKERLEQQKADKKAVKTYGRKAEELMKAEGISLSEAILRLETGESA